MAYLFHRDTIIEVARTERGTIRLWSIEDNERDPKISGEIEAWGNFNSSSYQVEFKFKGSPIGSWKQGFNSLPEAVNRLADWIWGQQNCKSTVRERKQALLKWAEKPSTEWLELDSSKA